MSPDNPARVAVEERLFSLVLALIATEIGLSKAEILSTVQGYRQRHVLGGDNASLERQFERDKDDLRELGIPLETIEPADDPGSNHNLRYRIPKGLYDLPADVTFSPDEVMLLKLAATVWREGSLSAQSRRALTKLNSLGIDSTDPVLGYAPRLRVRDPAFEPLSKALDRAQDVAFLYLKPGESAPRRRVIAPRALVQHEGRWHLYATDRESAATRTFLLSRIVGAVVTPPGAAHTANPAATSGTEDAARNALTELDALWARNTAELLLTPGSDAAVRLGKRRGDLAVNAQPAGTNTPVTLHFTDLDILADELAGYGPEVLVLSPERLRAAVRERLERICQLHTPLGEEPSA